MTAGLFGEALDERPVEQPAHDRDHKQEPDAQPWEVEAADPAHLAELLMTGGQPRRSENEPPETDCPQTGARADEHRHDDHPEPRRPQPRRRRREDRRHIPKARLVRHGTWGRSFRRRRRFLGSG